MKNYFCFLFIALTYFYVSSQEHPKNISSHNQDSIFQDHLEIKFFTLEDGLSQVSSNDLLLDKLGFVWIATQDGLNRFDGKVFKHFKHNQSDSTTISGNLTNKLLEDHKGNIWVGTIGNGLNYYNPNLELFHRIKLENSTDENEIISGLATNQEGDVWVASRISGLHRIRYNDDGSFLQKNYFADQPLSALLLDRHENLWVGGLHGKIYKLNSLDDKLFNEKPEIIVKGNVQAFYKTDQHLLVGSDFGFYIYDLQTKKVRLVEFESHGDIQTKHVVTFLKKSDSTVWIGTGNGLYLFNWKHGTVLKKIAYTEGNAIGLSNNTVQSLLRVSPDQILAGTANYLNLIDFKEPYFNNISKNKKGNHLLNDNVIFSILKDGNDLWIGTSDGGLNLIRNNKTYVFKTNNNDPTSLSGDVVRSIVKDEKDKRLWLATTRGLSMINLKTFDPRKPKFTVFKHDPDDTNSINGDFIKDLALDKNNTLWGATYGYGIFRLTIDNRKVKIFQYKNEKDNSNSLKNNYGQCIKIDRYNNIWIGTQGGLTKLIFMKSDYHNPIFTNYFRSSSSKNPLSHNSIYDIQIDKNDQIWLGTRHGFNLFLGENEFESWTSQKQFPNDIVYSIQDDLSNNLWLGTNDGMVKFNTLNRDFTHYSIEDNIQSKEFNIHAKYRGIEGSVYLGGIGGVTYFNPKNLENIDSSKHLYFSQLRVKDKIIKPNNNNNLLNQSISSTNELTFKHNQFPFYLQFSSIDFRMHKNVEFAYKLLPTDSEWNTLNDPEIQFLNLAPGNYTLQLNGFSRGKEWNQPPLEMNINIKSPWWSTNLAYLIYAAILIFLADRIYRFQLSRKIADSESKRLKEINQLKNALFTNITHEFRTPLTVIKGMTDSIKSDLQNSEHESIQNSLEMIERNSDSLLHLVNEMLDLSKIESGKMELQLIQSDVIPFLKYLSESFSSFAEENKINLTIYSETDSLIMDFDGNKLTSVISNLLSNAIKFTPEYGKIIVHINEIKQKDEPYLFIKIKDNGIGISKEELPNIFNRFYQTDASTIRKHEGTGIGLALTKELVELMHGTIEANSMLDKGSEFSVMIPITRNAPKATEVQIDTIAISPVVKTSSKQTEQFQEVNSKLPLVLIIEDNMDVAHYLKTCLTNKYETIHAVNGIEGIEMALEKIPDIIICDVMMPGKDGFEVCETLKTDERSDHIPIIILTAKASREDRLTGLSHGADAYLAKPFNKEELFTRLDQLISLRKKLINKIQDDGFNTMLKNPSKDPKLQFLKKVVKLIHEDIGNSNFGSKDLAKKLLISESQLYRKIKAITEKSTAVFIRSIRLQHAKELLSSTNKTVSEIAYEVGFNDPSWFSRAFKDEYGHSPSITSK